MTNDPHQKQISTENEASSKRKDPQTTSEDGLSESASYTRFTPPQLRRLRLLLGLGTITSPLTATIYLPLLPPLRRQFHTSAQGINLTLTIYIIFQAISPVIFGPFSDAYGRRPIFLLTLGIYVLGNIGLAVNQQNYAALLVLRALQSLGASAAYAISFGVVADVCLPSERGRMLGPINMALNLGACIGPVVGGVVSYANGNHIWVFWSLVIIGTALFWGVALLLPETGRDLVGNGSDPSLFNWWQMSGVDLVSHWYKNAGYQRRSEAARPAEEQVPAYMVVLKNLMMCFKIIFHRDSILVLWMHSSFYTVDYCFVTAVPDVFEYIYDYNEWQLGLAYLPRGVGIILGSYFTGRYMDRNYQATLRKLGWTQNKVRGEDMFKFPIEKARTTGSYMMLVISTTTIISYGWVVERTVHPAAPLVLQFIQGFWGTYFYTTYSALLVDTFPASSSTAAAATSVTRCAMAAAGVALIQPLLESTGRGWYFTALGIWSGVFGVVAVALLRTKGMEWRKSRTHSDQ